jgi:hypothetical protein
MEAIRVRCLLHQVNRTLKLLISQHLLVLTVAGWLLMTPRVTLEPKGDYQAAMDTPFSEWSRQGPYDTILSCNQAKEVVSRIAESKVRQNDPNSVAIELGAYAAECIAQDDPRLKGK